MPVVHVVPHTHWDREWYLPFQDFRRKLVPTLDTLFEILEAEPGYRFMLDGQAAMIDDYLAVRPERAEDFSRHARRGLLDVGPWTALPDTLLVSAETIVRNLQSGMERAAEIGPCMDVAYMPDMFGHTAQMPQILAQFGFHRAVLWRGVPSDIERTVFRWHALDGSTQFVGYLAASYSNGVALPTDPDDLVERIAALEDEQRPFSPPGHLLVMNGTDHWPPQRGLGEAIEKANVRQDVYDIRMSSLDTYLDSALAASDITTLPEWTGELRSGARANVLMGVTSTRVDLKRIQAAAERALERYAEPLVTLAGALGHLPLLREAWHRLILNSAHDSVCSCSADATMRQVQVRYEEAVQLGDGVTREALRALAARIGSPTARAGETGLIVWNPCPFPRSAVVTVDMPLPPDLPDNAAFVLTDDSGPAPTVELDRRDRIAFDAVLTATELDDIVNLVRGRVFAGTFVNGFEIRDGPTFVEVALEGDRRLRGHVDANLFELRLRELADEDPDRRFHVVLTRRPTARLQLLTPEIAPLGWTTLRVTETPEGSDADARSIASPGCLDNGIVRVEFEGDGTFRLVDPATRDVLVRGLGVIEDGGDVGDTYNWSPPPTDTLVTEPERAVIEVAESTPLSGAILVTRPYPLPVAATEDASRRSDETTSVAISMHVRLDAGSRVAEVSVAFDNTVRDHRLRLRLPLPEPVDGSTADVAFGAVGRDLTAEGGPGELPLPTFPAKRFIDCSGPANGLTVLLDQTVEYEVVRDAPDGPGVEIALTLVRATGSLSRQAPSMRPNPAGPPVPTEHSQSLGLQYVRFGVLHHTGGWEEAAVARAADTFAHPLRQRVFTMRTAGELPPTCDPFGLDLEGGALLSAVVPQASGGVEMRFANVSASPAAVGLDADTEWARAAGLGETTQVVDLRGEALAATATFPLTLNPWRIMTLRCDSTT
ncbi:MAG: hypothetical protein IT198_06135 [Acidimicrobiia bacterium]|nr:hypothetical protein [Acidimicrobiia bacterium]